MDPMLASQERKLPLTECPQIVLPKPGGGGTLDPLKQATLKDSNLSLVLRSAREIHLFPGIGGQVIELQVFGIIADKMPLRG